MLHNRTDQLLKITVLQKDGTTAFVESTGKHPFWTKNRGWQYAHDLKTGDFLQDAQGSDVHIVKFEQEQRDCSTYNLTIDDKHTYFVVAGATSILVHNVDPLYGPLAPFQIVPMNNGLPTGPLFQRHELLQASWFRANGLSSLQGQNLGMYLEQEGFHSAINTMQHLEGLHDPAVLRGMLPEVNIQMNADIMLRVGVPEEHVANFVEQAMANAERIGALCPH